MKETLRIGVVHLQYAYNVKFVFTEFSNLGGTNAGHLERNG